MNNQKQSNRRKIDPEWTRLQQASMARRNELLHYQCKIDELRADVHPNVDIVVEYFVDHENHDGYCSDPENITIRRQTFKETSSLPKLFKEIDGNFKYTIDATDPILQKLFSKSNVVCDRGSG